MINALMLSPQSGQADVRQVQKLGDGSVGIQSGGNVTITASNGSVAAWSVNGGVSIGAAAAPPPPKHRTELSWKGRSVVIAAVWLAFHTAYLALAITVLLTGEASWATYVSLALNPLAMAYHAHTLRAGVQERLAARAKPTPDPANPPDPMWHHNPRQFTASCDCPNPACGAIATHHLRAPGPEDPAFADGVVIRTCTSCGQEWTES